ncbi:hypothetical protein Sjap_021135 [Stephania japonica]|uniref:Uncharacterized protein n=1 Tax=Stephania japonica TaxID=461633 RepID=A0AAP0F220_9MAGN
MGNACCNGIAEDELFETNFSVGSKASSSEVLCKRRDGSSNVAEERLNFLKRKGRPSDGLKNSGDQKGVVRVKIVLTKRELALLLTTSKSSTAEAETLNEILKGLQRNDSNKSNDMGSGDVCSGFLREPWKPTLASIPEEC